MRPPAWDDVDAISDVVVASEVALRGESNWEASDTRDWLKEVDFDHNAWVVECAARLVAVGALHVRGELLNGWLVVDPEFTGRGIGRTLIEAAEARACELNVPAIMLGTLAENTAGRSLLEDSGFREIRHYFEMRIELDGPPPRAEWPDDIVGQPFELEEARSLHAAINEAFADEWNFYSRPFDEWAKHRLEAEDFDPTLWFIAHDGDEIAAFALCYAKKWGSAHVGLLGVRKPWRRRGLGLALLREAFAEFYSRGERTVALGVDAENPTGATRLYERAGMRVHTDDVIFEKALA